MRESTRVRLLALGISLLVTGTAVTTRADWVSPGPLAEPHADLDRSDRCDKCHEPGAGVVARRCIACHSEAAGPPTHKSTWHWREMVDGSGKRCQDCHGDHRGRSFPLIRWTPPKSFDHAKTGFELTGAHGALDCSDCHTKQPRYMGLKTRCAACHHDPHAGQLEGGCERCHTTESFLPPSRFDHAKTDFPLLGRHTTVSCATCHRARSDGKPRYDDLPHRRCADCHADPHEGRTVLSDCSTCHEVGGWEKTRGLPPAHGPAGWPLQGKHAKVECADCHGVGLTHQVERACASCHADPHAGRFGADCAKCHKEDGWKQAKPKGFDHSLTRFQLVGRHQTTRCEACHKPRGSFAATYKGLPFARCTDCHRDPHQMQFVSVEDRCTSCHDELGFAPAAYGPEQHERARMPLQGSHLAVPCARCHAPRRDGVPELKVPDTRCAACHKSPHGEQFAATIAERGCEACHTTRGFRLSAFDHAATRFPLRGAHELAACGSCHKGVPVQYEGLPLDCEGCHRDPHMAQFRSPPVKACVGCHTEKSFKIEEFDHKTLAGWPLEGAHAKVRCEGCHRPIEVASARIVQWRLGARDCASCHVNPHTRGSLGGRP